MSVVENTIPINSIIPRVDNWMSKRCTWIHQKIKLYDRSTLTASKSDT